MNIVLSGPSGSGKGTLTELLLKSSKFKKFTTCTTRKPRENEKNGFDYYFLNEETFLNYVNSGEMHNVKKYGGNYYGSFEENIDNIRSNQDIIFQLTPDRAMEMKQNNPNTCLILVLPPNASVLNFRRKDRSQERIQNDIQNLENARNFDYVIINDNLADAYNEILNCISNFRNGNINEDQNLKNELISKFILELNMSLSNSSGVEQVFNGEIAKRWDEKAKYVTYYGIKNPIKSEIMSSIHDGISVADIGCGAGKIIQRIDKNVSGCRLTGLDISHDMISVAEQKQFTGDNRVNFINNDFMKYQFNDRYDIIIFSYVLHHMDNPIEALIKARNMLTNNGKIIFSVPGSSYLLETFEPNELNGRYSIDDMDNIVAAAGLFPISAKRNKFLMQFNSYEMFIKYLKSIGTYQKINGYSNEEWNEIFNSQIVKRFSENPFITGEYLTYNCEDKAKILTRR